MKTRIISGVLYAALVIAVLFLMNTPALALFVALASAVGVYEMNNIVKADLSVMIPSIAVAAFIPINVEYELLDKINIQPLTALSFYVIAMLIIMVVRHNKNKFEQVAVSIFSSLAIPEALSCWIRLHDVQYDFDGKYNASHAIYLILFAFFCAWLTDTFAYFSGVAFGKHKMTPVISPKKTWEGAVGGVLLTAAANIALYFIFKAKFFTSPFTDWEWYTIIPISIIISIISIFGDLSASVIKRNFGVKDYGWIIPGHGGVMDRFDSMVFVLPTMYAIVCIINAF
ncbi:MAG: phosphatidate cytidylyltransferase [Clostridia bacterium]|nr:phosphatidate cytidylyltransferase [Clostridia bacterium]